MGKRLALVIVVDGLRASALGTYGNTIFPTPFLDSLAARAVVAEWLLAESPNLGDYYQTVWHRMPEALKESQVLSKLLTDDPSIADRAKDEGFTEVILVDSPVANTASKFEETQLARFFGNAIEQLAHWEKEISGDHGLFWIHLRGLTAPWDAPLEMRTNLLDEEDPTPLTIIDAPASLQISEDPDELLSYQVGYGAQVQLLDSCIAGIVEAFEGFKSSAELLTIVTSSRGFALGEHDKVGHTTGELYSEQLHLPCLVSVGRDNVPMPRFGGFSQPSDLRATLLDWFGFVGKPDGSAASLLQFLSGESGGMRQLALAHGPAGQQMIRTPAWMLLHPAGEGSAQLFVKPDDRWEVNDVASRCGEIVEQLNQLLAGYPSHGKNALNLRELELPEDLVSPQR